MGSKAALEERGFKMGPPRQPFSDIVMSNLNSRLSRIEEKMKPLLKRITKGEIG